MLGFDSLCPISLLTLLVSRRHVVIVHGYSELEASLHAVTAIDASKGVIMQFLLLSIYYDGLCWANPGAITTKVTFISIKI
jgi:hypothetical protein